MVNGKFSRCQIARMSDVQIRSIIFKKRDESGSLIRGNSALPSHVKVDRNGMRVISGKPVRFEKMFRQVNKHLPEERVDQAWKEYKSRQYSVMTRMKEELKEQDMQRRRR